MVELLRLKKISIHDDLEKIVLFSSYPNLAYVDGRKKALKHKIDVWKELRDRGFLEEDLKGKLNLKNLYTDSQIFPDFMFKSVIEKRNGKRSKITGGEILELKDSAGSGIASFNSTIPTKYKTLEDIEKLNGVKGNLIIKIAELFDENSKRKNWKKYKRHCFYLIRTNKNRDDARISIVDGAFFETLPEKILISQMFKNIFRRHAEKYNITENIRKNADEVLDYLTDHTLISFSQDIRKSSIKPRLRIMAEAKKEGNPHWRYYKIDEKTSNLILKVNKNSEKSQEIIEKWMKKKKIKISVSKIKHKNDGNFIVFTYHLN